MKHRVALFPNEPRWRIAAKRPAGTATIAHQSARGPGVALAAISSHPGGLLTRASFDNTKNARACSRLWQLAGRSPGFWIARSTGASPFTGRPSLEPRPTLTTFPTVQPALLSMARRSASVSGLEPSGQSPVTVAGAAPDSHRLPSSARSHIHRTSDSLSGKFSQIQSNFELGRTAGLKGEYTREDEIYRASRLGSQAICVTTRPRGVFQSPKSPT